MAASFIRCLRFVAQKQFRSSARLLQKSYNGGGHSGQSRSHRLLKLLGATGGPAGAGGVSYAFFGFGKKEEEVDVLTQTYREARLAHQSNDLEKADELYHQGLKLADEQLKNEEITAEKALTARVMMYDGLANIALRTGQIDMAKTLFIETMKGCIQQGMEMTDNAMIDMSLKLSGILAMQGQRDEAEEGFLFCVGTQTLKMKERETEWRKLAVHQNHYEALEFKPDGLEEKEQDTAVLLGMALGSYGRFLLHEKRYKEALPYLERARLYAQHTLGTHTNQYIIMLNDIATVQIMARSYENAEKTLTAGIDIAKKAELEDVAMLFCNLGAVHLRRENIGEADRACHTAATLARKYGNKMALNMANNCIKKCAEENAKSGAKLIKPPLPGSDNN